MGHMVENLQSWSSQMYQAGLGSHGQQRFTTSDGNDKNESLDKWSGEVIEIEARQQKEGVDELDNELRAID